MTKFGWAMMKLVGDDEVWETMTKFESVVAKFGWA